MTWAGAWPGLDRWVHVVLTLTAPNTGELFIESI